MKHLYLILICVLLVSCKQGREEPKQEPDETSCPCCKVLTQDESTCGGELAWDYPVKPGTEEWNELSSTQQREDTCQIPENILSSLSTEDLTKICLQYPFLYSFIFAQNCRDSGFEVLLYEFNGIRELYQRDDVSKELLKQYRCAIQNLSALDSDSPDFGVIINISILDCLLSWYYSENNDAQENYREILLNLLCGYEKELMYPEYFGYIGNLVKTNYFARMHLIINICPQCFGFQEGYRPFLCGNEFSKETADKINELSYQLLNIEP